MTHLGSPHDVYEFLEQIGDGSFGTVHKARNKISHKLVAVKVMKKKYNCIEDCQSQFEPKLLKLLSYHVNIVQLYDSFLSPTSHDLSFVMEYMDGGNLYQLMRERRHHNVLFNSCELRNILHQILSAVSHIHKYNVFHRDMKPENLLLDYSTGRPIIKLADFGLAKEMNSVPPFTEYVSTRWYRAPEVLLRSVEYSAPVDLWAIGAIFAELITLEPLFPGESEIDQIYRICDILGNPGNRVVGQKSKVVRPEKRASPGFARKKTKDVDDSFMYSQTKPTISLLDGGGEWREGVKLAYKIGFKFPPLSPKPLESVITNATESMLDLIKHLLFFNPQQRWSADFALKHVFFTETDEDSVHQHVVTPITPPDSKTTIAPLDLLDKLPSTSQVCPDWDNIVGQPMPLSRHGKLCSSINDLHNKLITPIGNSSSTNSSKQLENDSNMDVDHVWLAESRPIYSSHQKVHPVTDRPNSSLIKNYSYANYNYPRQHHHQRPHTPIVEHSSSSSGQQRPRTPFVEHVGNHTAHHHHHHQHHKQRPHTPFVEHVGNHKIDEFQQASNKRSSQHHHIHHHPQSNHGVPPQENGTVTTLFNTEKLPHYGTQLIKWAPQHFVHHPRQYPSLVDSSHPTTVSNTKEEDQSSSNTSSNSSESRQRARLTAPFSSSSTNTKQHQHSNKSTGPFSTAHSIRHWTPPATAVDPNHEHDSSTHRKGGTVSRPLLHSRLSSCISSSGEEEKDKKNEYNDKRWIPLL